MVSSHSSAHGPAMTFVLGWRCLWCFWDGALWLCRVRERFPLLFSSPPARSRRVSRTQSFSPLACTMKEDKRQTQQRRSESCGLPWFASCLSVFWFCQFFLSSCFVLARLASPLPPVFLRHSLPASFPQGPPPDLSWRLCSHFPLSA